MGGGWEEGWAGRVGKAVGGGVAWSGGDGEPQEGDGRGLWGGAERGAREGEAVGDGAEVRGEVESDVGGRRVGLALDR